LAGVAALAKGFVKGARDVRPLDERRSSDEL
jgi:hypothetical protein